MIYVSQTATNGYAIGADTCTRGAVTKSTPCLTIIKALSIANSGDTVTINDGTYNETSYLAPSVTNLTITAETDYQAIIRTSDVTRVLYLGSLGTGLTIGKVVLDANSTTANSLNTGSGNSTLTINGTKFLNYKTSAISSGTLTSLTMLGGWLAVSSYALATLGLNLNPAFAATYDISNGTITHSAMTSGGSLIAVVPTATGVSLTIHDVILNATEVSGSTNVWGVLTSGASSITIYNNTFTFVGALGGGSIKILNNATITTNNVSIHNNTGNLGFDQSVGGTYLMLIGDDGTPTTSNNINNVLVYGNSFSHANHGYAMGHISGARVYGNTADYVAIGVLSKNDGAGTGTGNIFTDNIIKHCANFTTPSNGWPMFSKGGVNDIFANNTIIITTAYIPNKVEYVDFNGAGQYATGIKFYNNNIYAEVSGFYFVVAGVGSDATFSKNNYYSTVALTGNPFWYQGTYYTSVALWQAAHESGADAFTPTDPLFVDYAGGDYRLMETSPLIDTGTVASGVTTDYTRTNSIYGTPDIGAYEYQPPYTIGTNTLPATGSARIYSNGKYRMTTASSTSATANLVITPIGGSYQSTTTEYMNTTISTWSTSGDYAKTWTETSTTATSTVHTIGDLAANTHYTVNVDGTQYVAAQSNSSGEISFTYTGGYSTHTFNVSADASGPLAFSPSSPANNANISSTQTFTWGATTDPSAGIAKYQLYVDGALNQDNITGTTFSPTTSFSCGNHPWYVRAVDNAGNGTNSDTYTFSVTCGGGPLFTGPASSLPGYVAPRMQTITDGIVTYLDEKVSVPATPTPSMTPLISVPAPTFTRPLKRGSRGSDATALQEFLKKDSIIYPEGLVTGYFGTLTEQAVQRFQKKYNIASVGIPGYGTVGPKTRAKLNALVGE